MTQKNLLLFSKKKHKRSRCAIDVPGGFNGNRIDKRSCDRWSSPPEDRPESVTKPAVMNSWSGEMPGWNINVVGGFFMHPLRSQQIYLKVCGNKLLNNREECGCDYIFPHTHTYAHTHPTIKQFVQTCDWRQSADRGHVVQTVMTPAGHMAEEFGRKCRCMKNTGRFRKF